MRRPGLLAALARLRSAPAEPPDLPFLQRIAARRAGLGDGSDGTLAPTRRGIRLPAGVSVESGVAYGNDGAQRLDVYRPAGASAAPLILFVHGGGWRRGDKAMPQMVANKVAHWAGKGWLFLSTNYRMLPAADPLQQAVDVAAALAFVQRHAGRWGGDGSRVVLMGHSAGAHLVALLTADPRPATAQGAQPWLASVAIDSAALDIEAVMTRPHYRFYDPVFGSDPAYWRECSPMHRLQGRAAAPILLVCSSLRDDSCPPASAFAARAVALGGLASVLPVALGHLEINDQLGMHAEYTEAVDAFLRSVGVA